MNKDTKIIKAVCSVVGIIAVMLVIGLVGGLENDAISCNAFIKAETVCIILLYLSIKGIDAMERIDEGRKVR